MWHWSGLNAKACWYRNQGLAITAQLDLGIRYFDFDVSYISAADAQGKMKHLLGLFQLVY